MGTPDEVVWKGVSTLPDYKATFPKWPKRSIGKQCPSLDAHGVDLLEKMLAYEPVDRITSRAALSHPYFADLDKSTIPGPAFGGF
jgi:serine/threonine protein kinase